jgi:hypothetical protein
MECWNSLPISTHAEHRLHLSDMHDTLKEPGPRLKWDLHKYLHNVVVDLVVTITTGHFRNIGII